MPCPTRAFSWFNRPEENSQITILHLQTGLMLDTQSNFIFLRKGSQWNHVAMEISYLAATEKAELVILHSETA